MKPLPHADVHAELVSLVRPHDAPCVSLHVPVDGREGAGPAATKLANAARAVKPAVDAWAGDDPAKTAAAAHVLASLDGIVERLSASPWESPGFAWAAPTRGLAVFVAPHFSAVHRLAVSPPELAACHDAFHVRPLLEEAASNLRFHVLAVHRDEVRLFEATAGRMRALPLGDIPATMALAVGTEFDDSQHGRGFHGAPAHGKARGSAAPGTHFHGWADSNRDEEKDTQRFLQRIGHSLPRGMAENGAPPFVLMTVDKTLGLFRKLHPNVQLAEGGVAFDPHGHGAQELHARAWDALAPIRERRVAEAVEAVEAALPRGRASKDLVAIAKAAVTGRVGTLVLAEGRHDAGRLDEASGELTLDGPGHRGPDVLERLAAITLLHRGDVLFAPHAKLHAHAGAIYRY